MKFFLLFAIVFGTIAEECAIYNGLLEKMGVIEDKPFEGDPDDCCARSICDQSDQTIVTAYLVILINDSVFGFVPPRIKTISSEIRLLKNLTTLYF